MEEEAAVSAVSAVCTTKLLVRYRSPHLSPPAKLFLISQFSHRPRERFIASFLVTSSHRIYPQTCLAQPSTMSRAAKLTLAGTSAIAASIVYFVHFQQKAEKAVSLSIPTTLPLQTNQSACALF